MSRMANNLLELSRLESSEGLERRPVDLVALAEETLAQLAPRAQEREIAIIPGPATGRWSPCDARARMSPAPCATRGRASPRSTCPT
jgi:signal transduction histidine kinase